MFPQQVVWRQAGCHRAALQACKRMIGCSCVRGQRSKPLGVLVQDNLRLDLDNLTSEDRTGGSVGL